MLIFNRVEMKSHDLARALLGALDGEIVCSVDISTEEEPTRRCFGEFDEINSLPTDEGFGSTEVQLLFSGSLNFTT